MEDDYNIKDHYDLYEPARNIFDDSIPDTVLAYPKGEWEKRKQDPNYKPVYIEVRNPAKIEEERKEKIKKEREEKRMKEIEDSLIEWKRSQEPPAPPAPQPPPPRPLGFTASYPPAFFAQGHQQSGPQMLPQFSSALPSLSGTLPAPRSNLPRALDSYTPGAGPPDVHPDVWQVVKDVRALPQNITTRMPSRTALTTPRFRPHFTTHGLLRRDSPLWPYKGDTRFFSAACWSYLTNEPINPY